jgi:hypothetical protein
MLIVRNVRFAALALAGSTAMAVQADDEGLVDLSFTPAYQTAQLNDIIEIDVVATSDGASGQPFATLTATLEWDPLALEFLGNDDSGADYTWFVSGFLNDPDGINDVLDDGDAIYNAWAQVGGEAVAPPQPQVLTVTTLRFRVVSATGQSTLRYLAVMGDYAETQVLALGAIDVTGDIESTAVVTAGGSGSCPADLDGDSLVGVNDFLLLLAAWGSDPGGPPDLDGDGVVGVSDFLALLAAWGPCPIG